MDNQFAGEGLPCTAAAAGALGSMQLALNDDVEAEVIFEFRLGQASAKLWVVGSLEARQEDGKLTVRYQVNVAGVAHIAC